MEDERFLTLIRVADLPRDSPPPTVPLYTKTSFPRTTDTLSFRPHCSLVGPKAWPVHLCREPLLAANTSAGNVDYYTAYIYERTGIGSLFPHIDYALFSLF